MDVVLLFKYGVFHLFILLHAKDDCVRYIYVRLFQYQGSHGP